MLSSRPPALDTKRPRRGRPPKIDNDQLLAIARTVFLEQGFRATTLEVAERAGISEGILFHRFVTKEGLFRAAMQLPQDNMGQRLIDALARVEQHTLKDALLELGTAVLSIGRAELPLMMMSWSNSCTLGGESAVAKHQAFKRIAGFFEAQMLTGQLRPMDAEVVARVFLGSLHHYCMVQIIAGANGGAMIPEGMFVRGLVELLLEGAAIRPDTIKQSTRSKMPSKQGSEATLKAPTKARASITRSANVPRNAKAFRATKPVR